MTEENTYLAAAYGDDEILAAAREHGYKTFQEMVAKLSAEGLSLQAMALRLGLVVQRFTAYHAKWMRDNAEPLNLEDV
jgi:hypothetical protein